MKIAMWNKRIEKTEWKIKSGQSRHTSNTGHRTNKEKKNKNQPKNKNIRWATRTPYNLVNSGAPGGRKIPDSYKTPAVILVYLLTLMIYDEHLHNISSFMNKCSILFIPPGINILIFSPLEHFFAVGTNKCYCGNSISSHPYVHEMYTI